ncbi:MAG: class IV adenylate cyclase [Chloroflexi bacterium]|nr:class IV adenylate cyclase [Chloroflexota bacterium]
MFERNVRSDDAAGSLTAAGAVLRLRFDSRARLTYKGPGVVSGGVISRFEAEVEVSDFDVMNLILTHLAFRQVFVYDKYRTTFRCEGCEVTLDEFRHTASSSRSKVNAARLKRAASELALSTARPVPHSYAGAFERVRRNMNLPFTDATFEAFSGISLSERIGEWLTESEEGNAAQ